MIGLCLTVFAAVMLLILPYQVPEASAKWGVIMAVPAGHRFFPMLSLILVLVCGLFIMIEGIYSKNVIEKKEEKKSTEDYKGFWVTAASWAVYAFMVIYIGYVVSTVLLLFFLLWYYGAKSMVKNFAITAGATLFLYVIFVLVMKLPFPRDTILF
jgi:uncharacterized membrane protein